MKHEKTETITTTVVSYSCDICKKELLTGARPFICGICKRETCAYIGCSEWQNMPHDAMRLCTICLSLVHFPQQLADIVRNYESEERSILEAWKEASLEKDHVAV